MRNSWPVPLLTPWPDIFYNKKEETVILEVPMDYMTVRRARRKMESLPRSVQQLCTQGEFPARGSLERPGPSPPMRKSPPIPNRGRLPLPEIPRAGGRVRQRDAHAPVNTPFLPGRCLETVRPWQRVPSETLRWRSTTISAAGRNRRRWKWSPKLLYPAHLL